MKRHQPIHSIIFDFDGTLADTRKPMLQSFWGALHDLNIALPRHLSLEALSCHTLEGMFRKIGIVDKGLMGEAVANYERRYHKFGPRKAMLFPDVADTLRKLKSCGYYLSIATNEKRANLNCLTKHLNIDQFFVHSVCEDEVDNAKPSPDMAAELMKRLEVAPEETMVVGDSVMDLRMGKAAGCKTCAVTYGIHPEEALLACGPNWMISDFPRILTVLEISDSRQKITTGQ